MKGILDALKEKPLLCDGAMGTQLQAAGLAPGECGEVWCLRYPDRVQAIQAAYALAGSDCLATNTFGGCRLALERHGLADETVAINQAAVAVAREAFGGKPGFVLGDIGPFGGLMEPYGTTKVAEVRAAFIEQARALLEGGADAVIIETMTSLEELEVALQAAREAGAAVVLASMSFDVTFDGTDARTMMGVTPEQAAEHMHRNGADVIGTNCGKDVDSLWTAKILQRYRTVSDLPLLAQPNAGQPELNEGVISYRQSATDSADGLEGLLNAGARLIGACCGSAPPHIRALRERLDFRPA
ncbi:MAG: homocysteine S-methyltransferase family protein [Acidobacteriota bacterium]|nr:MAG: homocysteine S-methyltransferase family protein [Acidobacteriota bacterium]